MQEYKNYEDNTTKRIYTNSEVVISEEIGLIEVKRKKAINTLQIKKKRAYKKSLKTLCNDEITNALFSTSDNFMQTQSSEIKSTANKTSSNNTIKSVNEDKEIISTLNDCKSDNSTNSIIKSDNLVNAKLINDLDFMNSIFLSNELWINKATGETIESIRSIKSMRESFKRQKEIIEDVCEPARTMFMTITCDKKLNYITFNKLITAWCRWLKDNFVDCFKCGFIFLETDGIGWGWHCHLLLVFENFSENFETENREYWAKKNKKLSEHQLDYQYLNTAEDLKAVISYLNPTSAKKIDTIKYYPLNAQCIRHFGNVEPNPNFLAEYEDIKKVIDLGEPTTLKQIDIVDEDNNIINSITIIDYNINFSFNDVSYRNDTNDEKIEEEQQPKEYKQLTFFPVLEAPKFATPLRNNWCDYKLSTLYT